MNKKNLKSKKPHVSLLIAAKNEGEGLSEIIQSVRPYADEIIVVDGHSNDATKMIAEKAGVRFFLDNKKGRGDALRIGIREAMGDVLVIFDADGSHEATDIPILIKTVEDGAELVICSRRTGGSFDANITIPGLVRSVGADMLTYFLNKRFNTGFTDILYSFRALNTNVAKRLPITANGFAVEQEMVVLACKGNYKITEIPSREKARGWGESKLKTSGGVRLFFELMKQLYID